MIDGAGGDCAPASTSLEAAVGVGVEPPVGDGAGAAVAVNEADVGAGAVMRAYVPACDGVYDAVPLPPAPIVTVNVLVEPSGAVTCTVWVENAVKPVRVMVLGDPTTGDDAVIIGEPGGDDVDAAPQRSDADAPMALTATMENVCHADALSPVAV